MRPLLIFFGIFAFIGTICLFAGVYVLFNTLEKNSSWVEIFTNGRGRKTLVPIADIIVDGSFKVNGRSPYVIVCQYQDVVSNKVYEFKSDYIWYNPAKLLEDKKEMDVYVDPNDLTRYYLDTSFLPKKA
ncbi:MAG: hypothetical protein KF725_14260 [Cyclobacteriaceae bacterium]|nr:hypothetical protein [Cyclobacteriaceae bacterium]UYN87475.1 MAG: hypothetical protein KIT51_04195 [Cyclobacteriaceae bacterium]